MTQQLLIIASHLTAGTVRDTSLTLDEHRARLRLALELGEELISMHAARGKGRTLSLTPKPLSLKPTSNIRYKVAEPDPPSGISQVAPKLASILEQSIARAESSMTTPEDTPTDPSGSSSSTSTPIRPKFR